MTTPENKPSDNRRIEGLCGISMVLSVVGMIVGVANGNEGVLIGSAVIFSGAMIGLAILARSS